MRRGEEKEYEKDKEKILRGVIMKNTEENEKGERGSTQSFREERKKRGEEEKNVQRNGFHLIM